MTFKLATDAEGFLGRQCTENSCKKYFKIKPGTGLTQQTRAFCPYCGHSDLPNDFFTDEQKAYALSLVGRKVMGEMAERLKKSEFDIKPKGPFGIGISLKIRHTPEPILYYVEREVETRLECAKCTLKYSIYGVFAYCPDCGAHNSVQILHKNLEVIDKLIRLGDSAEADVAEQLTADGLENAVSAFDGFGREVCRLAAARSTNPQKAASISFQNIEGARQRVLELFQLDIAAAFTTAEWNLVVVCFQKRHLIAHKMGVIDDKYVQTSGDPMGIVGRKVKISKTEVENISRLLKKIGDELSLGLGV